MGILTDIQQSPTSQAPTVDQQYPRSVSLVVDTVASVASGKALDLSLFRIKFATKQQDTSVPNSLNVRIYNLSQETTQEILQKPGKGQKPLGILLSAGYSYNNGVIFKGNIIQTLAGRENGTDTFVEIIAADGDLAFNFAVVNRSFAVDCQYSDQLKAALNSMEKAEGITPGYIAQFPTVGLPRGKVVWGNASAVLDSIAKSTGSKYNIDNGELTFIPLSTYRPDDVVFINTATGMVGSPQQTTSGVNVKCLLNPKIRCCGRIGINNASIQGYEVNLNINSATKDAVTKGAILPHDLNSDGIYYVLVKEHVGDTRGVEWYTNLQCLYLHPTANPEDSIQDI